MTYIWGLPSRIFHFTKKYHSEAPINQTVAGNVFEEVVVPGIARPKFAKIRYGPIAGEKLEVDLDELTATIEVFGKQPCLAVMWSALRV